MIHEYKIFFLFFIFYRGFDWGILCFCKVVYNLPRTLFYVVAPHKKNFYGTQLKIIEPTLSFRMHQSVKWHQAQDL